MTCSIKTALERLKVAQTTITLHDLDYPNKSYSAEAPIKLFSLFSWILKTGIYFSFFKRNASVVLTVSCSKQGKRTLKREDIWLLFKPRPFLLVYVTLYSTPVLKRAHTNQKISSIGLYCMALITYEFFHLWDFATCRARYVWPRYMFATHKPSSIPQLTEIDWAVN